MRLEAASTKRRKPRSWRAMNDGFQVFLYNPTLAQVWNSTRLASVMKTRQRLMTQRISPLNTDNNACGAPAFMLLRPVIPHLPKCGIPARWRTTLDQMERVFPQSQFFRAGLADCYVPQRLRASAQRFSGVSRIGSHPLFQGLEKPDLPFSNAWKKSLFRFPRLGKHAVGSVRGGAKHAFRRCDG